MNDSSDRAFSLVVSYGAGVDSTAMLVESIRRQMRPDYMLFADTGGEKPETLAFLSLLRQEQLVLAAEIAALKHLGPPQIAAQQRFQDGETIPPWPEFLTAVAADPLLLRSLPLAPATYA